MRGESASQSARGGGRGGKEGEGVGRGREGEKERRGTRKREEERGGGRGEWRSPSSTRCCLGHSMACRRRRSGPFSQAESTPALGVRPHEFALRGAQPPPSVVGPFRRRPGIGDG